MCFVLGPQTQTDGWRFSGQTWLKWTPHFKVSAAQGKAGDRGGEGDTGRGWRKRGGWVYVLRGSPGRSRAQPEAAEPVWAELSLQRSVVPSRHEPLPPWAPLKELQGEASRKRNGLLWVWPVP